LIAVGTTVVFAAAGSAVILLVLNAIMGLRVNEEQERMGLDLSQHSESAYVFASDFEEMPTSQSGHLPAGTKIRSQNA
jgi:ammonia channel protein AmtB